MQGSLIRQSQGTMANRATDLFVGDFTQLLIGQRLGITIQVLTERYAEYGQMGLPRLLLTRGLRPL